MDIPLLDLKAQYSTIKNDIEKVVFKVLESSNYIMGSNVKDFEEEIARYIGTKYAVGVANGTDALILALTACGIKEGDEVITSPFTFFATAEAISQTGATPVFVDIDELTYCISSKRIEEKITPRTKAILPVHIFGQACDMDELKEIAQRYELYLIEDACQAIGAEYKRQKVGGIGQVGCFSFFPTKNLGGYGDGGIITTNDDNIAKIVKALRVHGSGKAGRDAYEVINSEIQESQTFEQPMITGMEKYYNYLLGYNSRLDELQAAILRIKLKHLDTWNTLRKEKAGYYTENLRDLDVGTPFRYEYNEHIYHLYILQSGDRDALVSYLGKYGISTGIYYPIPLHLQIAYKNSGYENNSLKVAEYISKKTFALPLYPEISREQQDYVIEKIRSFYGK